MRASICALTAISALAACAPIPAMDEMALALNPPAPSPPPPATILDEPIEYCGDGFAIEARQGATVRLFSIPDEYGDGLFSTLYYPGTTLMTADWSLGVHEASRSDWPFDYHSVGEFRSVQVPGLGEVEHFALDYEETGQGTRQTVGYAFVTEAGNRIFLLLSDVIDGSAADLAKLERVSLFC